ncbi:hypothetical protein KKB28_02115 [bacterium]|nr:hypothetical protein [bacterium]
MTTAVCQPSYYLYDVAPPSGTTEMLRPSSVYFDARHDEIYVADTGNNRIVIFDNFGNYIFEFADRKHLSAPGQVAVDSLGRIFVLCKSYREKLSIFDYNGTFLRDLNLTEYWLSFPFADSSVSISSFLLDENDQLFVLRGRPTHIYVYSSEGQPLYDFPLFENLDAQSREQSLLGTLSIVNGDLVIPMPIFSQLARYTKQGEFVRIFGYSGGGKGELSFPIAAAEDGQGGLLVLDKHRHTILQYTDGGKFIQEFGGMGTSPGWFYHPRALAVNEAGQGYVTQSFMNRIQTIQIAREDASQENEFITAGSTKLDEPKPHQEETK